MQGECESKSCFVLTIVPRHLLFRISAGDRGFGNGVIPAKADLKFTCELMDIK